MTISEIISRLVVDDGETHSSPDDDLNLDKMALKAEIEAEPVGKNLIKANTICIAIIAIVRIIWKDWDEAKAENVRFDNGEIETRKRSELDDLNRMFGLN